MAALRQIKVNALTQARLIKLMLEGEHTCEQLAKETGLHYSTVLEYTRELYLVGAVHISHWELDACGRHTRRVYKIGQGHDAKRRRMTATQRSARYRQKKRMQALIHATAGQRPAPKGDIDVHV